MAKKNEIIVKDVSIKTMTINGDNKGVEFDPYTPRIRWI